MRVRQAALSRWKRYGAARTAPRAVIRQAMRELRAEIYILKHLHERDAEKLTDDR